MVVDDSAFARKVISTVINSAVDLEVVSTASSGEDALSKIPKVMPDIITLDIEMPGMGGINTLQQIVDHYDIPVVVLSAIGFQGAEVSLQCLEIGAVDVVLKPMNKGLPDLSLVSRQIVSSIRHASAINAKSLSRLHHIYQAQPLTHCTKVLPQTGSSSFPIVVIASSTGGPRALRFLLPRLNASAEASYIVVQHLPSGFSKLLARDLNTLCSMNVREAQQRDSLKTHEILIAPSGLHMAFNRSGYVDLNEEPAIWGVRPSADVTMSGLATTYPNRVIGVVLTGMGKDGTEGASIIKQNGGYVLAEAESSCVIYGMPRSAVEKGVVDEVVDLEEMPDAINRAVRNMTSVSQING